MVEASTAIDPLSAPSAAQSPTLSLRQPGKMSSPPSEDPLAASFDFLSEFLPAVDFGEAFRFDAPFDFDDFSEGNSVIAAGGLSSYGSYDDDSCSFSVESSVRLCRRRRRRRKRRSPNRLYRKESVLSSSWYKNFLWPGLTRDLTHELSTSDRFGEFRSLF